MYYIDSNSEGTNYKSSNINYFKAISPVLFPPSKHHNGQGSFKPRPHLLLVLNFINNNYYLLLNPCHCNKSQLFKILIPKETWAQPTEAEPPSLLLP